MTDRIDPRLGRALDAFAVPELPADFTERMVALAEAEPPAAAPARPRRRLRLWLGGMAIAGTGFVSFSAAAMGYLGEPLHRAIQRVPVVHRLVERIVPHRHPPAGRLAPQALAPLASPAPVLPAPSYVAPAPLPSAAPLAVQPAPVPAGAGLRRAAAAAAIWQAHHPDEPLPRRFAVPPGTVRVARPWSAPSGEGPAPRLRIMRERRAAGPGPIARPAPAPAAPPIVAPPAAPVAAMPMPRVEPPAGAGAPAGARPWRWWEQGGMQGRRGWRQRQQQVEGGGGAIPAMPPADRPAPERPAADRPEAQVGPADHPRRAPHEPGAQGPRFPQGPHGPRGPHGPHGGGRRRF